MFYWFTQNFYVIFLSLSLIVDFEFSLLLTNFIFLHIFYGLSSILKDYIHVNDINIVLIFLSRLLIINMLNTLIEIIF
nr:succinate dehydrogenase subunit 4 [Neorhodomela munita]